MENGKNIIFVMNYNLKGNIYIVIKEEEENIVMEEN